MSIPIKHFTIIFKSLIEREREGERKRERSRWKEREEENEGETWICNVCKVVAVVDDADVNP